MNLSIARFCLLVCLILGSCTNPSKYQDVVYFTGTETSNVLRFSLENSLSRGISVRASSKVTHDVSVDLNVDLSLVNTYNEEHKTNYKAMPEGSYSLASKKTSIKAGGYISDPVMLEVTSTTNFKGGDIYCLPITISSSEYPVLEASRTVYVIVNKVVITQATDTSQNYFFVPWMSDTKNPKHDDLGKVSQVTMEARINVTGLIRSDPYISTIMGWEENFMLRIGDTNNVPQGTLQLSASQQWTGGKSPLPLNKWVHVAGTYDGEQIKLYINGSLVSSTEAKKGTISFLGEYQKFCIGTTPNYLDRQFLGYISEVRLWTRALTANEIQAGMCAVDPASKDLLAYWRFDNYKSDTEKNIVPDVTGHGYDAEGQRAITLIQNVKCAQE